MWARLRTCLAWLVALGLIVGPSLVQSQTCLPVAAEFVLTGLSNLDGNMRNHELGICLPHLKVSLLSNCRLTITPMFAKGAMISLLQVGETNGSPNIPRATDGAAAVQTAVETMMGYYYLEPRQCPSAYSSTVKGDKLLATDIADVIRRTLGVDATVLTSVAFTSNGITMAWLMQGTVANELAYTAIDKQGGPTMPDFQPFGGSTNNVCSLLDINPQPDFDVNPADGIVDTSAATLVGRVPRPIPRRAGYFICAIAPAGGSVKVTRSVGAGSMNNVRYAYTSDAPTKYGACPTGSFLYKLGAITAPGDTQTDSCLQCPRGSFAGQGAALCNACPLGQYQGRLGSRECQPCQYGYAAIKGAVRCMNCYYGRAYCSEGWSMNEQLFTCNSRRLPDGYSPEQGYAIVRPVTDPTNPDVAATYSGMFRACTIDTQQTVMAFNVSAECKVDMYVLGDLGRGGNACSQNAESNSITAFYTAPNIMAGLGTKGLGKFNVGLQAVMGTRGLSTQVFASSQKALVPIDRAFRSQFVIGLTPIGFSYLGGGDNGLGQNAVVQGVANAPCPPGTIQQTLNADGTTNPGENPQVLLSEYCVPCDVGTYCDTTSDQPLNCPAGTFGPTIGAKDVDGCVNCPIGTYQDIDGSYECMVCSENTFASTPGATQCAACGDGFEVSGSGSDFCNPCQPGTFRDATMSESCQPCRPGTSSGEAAASCTVCRPGTYAPTARSSSCIDCPRGTFQSKFGMQKCENCPAGSFQDARGQPKCKVCPSGTFNKNTGSFSPNACQACSLGQAAPKPGSASCTGCNPGFFSQRSKSAACTACNPGTFAANSGSRACSPCPRGKFSDKRAATSCIDCAIGTFSAGTGASRCNSCPAGAFTNSTGAFNCMRCPAGTYSTRTAANSVITCVQCPAGTFSYMEGSTECEVCPAGQYTANPGATNCEDCPLGTYSTADSSIRCLPCKQGFTTSSTGSSRASDCSVRTSLNNLRKAV